MAEKKITKREMFGLIREVVKDNTEMVAFIDHEIELLSRKNSKDKKPTVTQVANENIKAEILEGMVVDTRYTITDLMKSIPICADLSNQRVSALVRQLINEGSVVRTEIKRKAYFSKVA